MYLETVHQLRLSVGGITQVLHGVARQAEPAVAEVLELVRTSQVVHADETGWQRPMAMSGESAPGAGIRMDEALAGVLVSDFYADWPEAGVGLICSGTSMT